MQILINRERERREIVRERKRKRQREKESEREREWERKNELAELDKKQNSYVTSYFFQGYGDMISEKKNTLLYLNSHPVLS